MKRKFTFLMAAMALLCFMLPPMTGWGQTAVDVTLSTGSFNNNVITWTCADGNITIKQLKGTGSSNPNSSYISAPRVYKQNILSFVGNNGYTITNIDIKCDGSYYGSTKYAGTEISSDNNVDNNTVALNPTWSTANGGTHTIATVSDDGLSEIYIQNGHSTDASSTQLRITKITITYKVSGSVTATTVTIDASGLTNTDVYTSTSAGILSASVTETESGDAISGATVTWSSSDSDVATIGTDGVVTLVAVGTTTITASYAGESGVYGSSSGTYELTVTSTEPYVQPTSIEITPNYAFWGKTGQFSGNTYDELEGSKDNVSLNWVRGDGSMYANTTAMRFYKDNNLTFTAPVGFEIKSIVITFTAVQSDLAFNPEGYSLTESTGTWTGSSATVIMSRPTNATSYATISKFTITIGSPSSAVATTTTINVPTGFNTDIYQGTVAGTLTATVKDNDDNTVSEATITWESTDTDVATITDAGVVTLVATGTTTIKAIYAGVTDQYQASTGTYELTVTNSDPNAPGTENNPYTVAQAIANTPSSGTSDDVYIHGIVSGFYNTSIVGDGSSYRYYISDDGTTTNQLLVYKGKGLNNVAFSNADDLLVGDEVTILGGLTMYNSTPEVASGNYLTSWNRPASTTPSITLSSYSVNATAAETEGTLDIAYANLTISDMTDFAIQYYDAENVEIDEPAWITTAVAEQDPNIGEGYVVSYYMEENTGAARTAYFKVFALGDTDYVYSNLVTVTQAAPVVDYVTLPFNWAGGTKEDLVALNGVSGYGLGSNYAESNAPYQVKFDNNGDYILIKTDQQPVGVKVIVKMLGGPNTSYIAVQASNDGVTFDSGESLEISGAQNTVLTLSSTRTFDVNARYVKLLFTKGSNVGVGPISIAKQASFNTTVNGYGSNEGGYHLIASPIDGVNPVNAGMIKDNLGNTATVENSMYDLYWFNQAEVSEEWQNYRQEAFNLEAGKGYLYASKETAELTFDGKYFGNGTVNLTFDESATFAGWNLIGNPFGTTATVDKPSYRLAKGGSALNTEACTESTPVSAMEGLFVQATATGQTATFTQQTRGEQSNAIAQANLTVNQNGSIIDNAIVRFDGGQTLDKFQLRENSTRVYFTEDGHDYAIVATEAQGELPVNFKAAENGTYTINVATENLDVDYLHLIDNLTGTDVDLLATPTYTFESRKNDYASRFRLRFSANNNNNNNSVSDEFAFVSNGEIVIMNEGEATLQVIDMLGRTVSTQAVDGNARIDKMSANGVYVLRLIDGNEVKTQKIVIE